MSEKPLHPAEERRLMGVVLDHSARFDRLHAWAVALYRGEAILIGIALGVAFNDWRASRPPWPALAAFAVTFLSCHVGERFCFRLAQHELSEIKKLHDRLCGCPDIRQHKRD